MEKHEVTLSLEREGKSAKEKLTITDEKEQSASFTMLNRDHAKILYAVTISLFKTDDKNMTAKYSVERASELPSGQRNGILRNSYEQPIRMNEIHIEPLSFFSDYSPARLELTVRRIVEGKAKL